MNSQLQLIPTKQPSIFNVQLNLPFETRYIGKLDTEGEGTFLTKRKEKHLFKKLNSIGINYSLLKDEFIPFKWIVIDYQSRKLITSRRYFLKHGQRYKFSNEGFELQCFLSLDLFGIDKAREFESRLCHQCSLFEV